MEEATHPTASAILPTWILVQVNTFLPLEWRKLHARATKIILVVQFDTDVLLGPHKKLQRECL